MPGDAGSRCATLPIMMAVAHVGHRDLDPTVLRHALETIPGLAEVRLVDEGGAPELYVITAGHDARRDDRVIEALLALDFEDMHFVPSTFARSLPDGLRIL